MKRIVRPCLICILAGYLFQTGFGQQANVLTQAEPLQSALEEKKSEDGIAANAAISAVAVPVPEGGKPVVAKTDVNGNIHLLFDSTNGPKYVMSNDNGRTFGTPIAVVDEGSRKPGLGSNAK